MATAAGLVLTVAQTLLSALQTKDLRDVCSMFGYESKLEELKGTVKTIHAVLHDADSKHQELPTLGKDWIEKLKDAVYDADDLFDEFNTALQRKRMSGGKISRKVSRFLSVDNQLFFAAKISRKITKIRVKLDRIVKDHHEFGFSISNTVTDVRVPKREETSSYVYESSIIGREDDKESVLDLLLLDDSYIEHNVWFVSIVGFGGLGKTSLAQLVYNDERIKTTFELTLWVCVSEEFGMKEILLKMLGKSTSELNKEELQSEVRRKIEGKRYFLVLDDVWNESCNQWEEIRNFFLIGARGSRILVTTRSKGVARAIGDYAMHELKGLSHEHSWCLFERIAFEQEVVDDIVDLGKHIVKKCANVPLAIKVIGSMLRNQHKSKWEQFQELDLAKMSQGEDRIMPILKFSYYHLSPQLKSCFSYCAIFPKDYCIQKELLIDLWLAQGYPECPNDMQKVEDVGEVCFSTLLHRCFFQDIEKDEYGDIASVKMHDLIHDLAQETAGQELCLVMNDQTSPFNENIRHLSLASQRDLPRSLRDAPSKLRTVRTFLRPVIFPYQEYCWESDLAELLVNCRSLRVLDLCDLRNGAQYLPKTLLNLLHLRYLDLSGNYYEMLPKSISKLHNLQVLKLYFCTDLKELPEDLRELVNLRHLDINGCKGLTHMPEGMGSLTGLSILTMFVLGGGSSNQMEIGELRDLIPLVNLRGEFTILFKEGYSYDVVNAKEGSYLSNKKYITRLKLKEELEYQYDELRCDKAVIIDERLLEVLEPHHDIREIEIQGYKDLRLPCWAATLASSFPLLVKICLRFFNELEHLPQLSQLKHLRSLKLEGMLNVEYMEDDDNGAILPFYPSLEELRLFCFPNLKGWWRKEGVILAFSGVLKLEIEECPNLTSFPWCPKLKEFELQKFNEALTFGVGSNPSASSNDLVYCLDRLRTDDARSLSSLFGKTLQGIRDLEICCKNLMSLSGGGIEHMTNLQQLQFEGCENLDLEGEDDGMPWRALHNLSFLCLWTLPKVVNLPKGIQYLSSLTNLVIYDCVNLDNLPEGLHRLTSLVGLRLVCCPKLRSLPDKGLPNLTSLTIVLCGELMERCRKPDGEDWPKICHIPNLGIS